jgi:PAS domain-containing protein
MKTALGDVSLARLTPVHPRNHSRISTRRPNSTALISVLVGSLILDNKGNILSCTDSVARLSGIAADELADRPIKSLVPGVPLDPGTEGYNVAFVAFSSATGRVGSWSLVTANRKSVQVEGCFALLKVESRFLFRLELRWRDNASPAVEGKFPLRRPPSAGTNSIWIGRRRNKKHAPLILALADEPIADEQLSSRPQAQ